MSACLLLSACWGGGSTTPTPPGAWLVHQPGEAHAVALDANGDVLAVWGESDRSQPPLVLAKHGAHGGNKLWSVELHPAGCAAPAFAPAIALAADGDIVVAAAAAPGEPICVAAFHRDGKPRWSIQLDHERSLSKLRIMRDGLIAVAGDDEHIAALSPDGKLVRDTALPIYIERLWTAGDRIVAWGFAVKGGFRVDLDPATPELDDHELLLLDRTGKLVAERPNKREVASIDASGATYEHAKLDPLHMGAPVSLTRVAPDGREQWSRELGGFPGEIRGAPGAVAVPTRDDMGPWQIVAYTETGDQLAHVELFAALERGQVPISLLEIDGISIGAHGIAVAGWGAKRVSLGPAGGFTTPCHLEARIEPADPPETVDDEHCALAGFVAYYPLAR